MSPFRASSELMHESNHAGDDFELPHTALSHAIHRGMQLLDSAIAWIWLVLMLVIVANVTLRYLFGEGRIEFEEIQWHLYAVGFLFGLSTCLNSDDHIRVDIFHARLKPASQCWVELYGLVILFFPFVLLVFFYSIGFVQFSFAIAEVSDAPGGLPYRWLIKGVLATSMLLLAAAGLGRLLRVLSFLFGFPNRLAQPSDRTP